MLDHRVYRVAFLPALVVLMLAAFSLTDRPAPSTTRVAPDAFDAARALRTIEQFAASFPDRRPGTAGDLAMAQRLEERLAATGFAEQESIRTDTVSARTVAGRRDLRLVLAERQGLSSRRIVVLAHRDALAGAPDTTLSGSAVLIELARVLSDRDLRATVVLASVSGGTGGYAGARAAIERVRAPIDAVLVLGDLASERTRRPWVVPWAASGDPAPHGLRRTVEAAVRTEAGESPGSTRALAQWARRAAPVTVSEQGVVGAQGVPAVLLSATGELGPRPGDRLSQSRLRAFGRAALRAFSAIEGARPERGSADPAPAFEGGDGLVLRGRLMPDWAVRLSVLALLMPALLAGVDAFFRVRRRRAGAREWSIWAASLALPFLLAWAWLRLLGALGLGALPAPAPPGAVELGAAPALALGSVAVVLAAGFAGLRPMLLRATGTAGAAPAGAAPAVGLLTGLLALVVWVRNPYAAAVLLPAAHLWLLVPATQSRLRGVGAVVAVLGGLVAPLLLVAYFVVALELEVTEGLRLVFDLAAGGEAGLLDAVALSLVCGLAIAALLALRIRAAAPPAAERGGSQRRPPHSTRGPGSYAGPGSLGGTDSALRR